MSYSDPQIGESLAVQITSKNPQYGLFVSTPNGISGLIRKLNISWSYQNRFYDSLHVGDYIQAIVTKVHPDGKIELSRKDACANPRDLNLDLILKGCVDSVENYGILIRFDGFIGLAPWVELTSTYYKAGDEITCVVKSTAVEENGMVKVTLSTHPLHSLFARMHNIGDRVTAKYVGINQAHDNPTAVISVEEGLFLIELTENFFIEPYKSKMISGALSPGQSLEFVYSKFNENKSTIWLDMRPIEKENKRKLMEDLIAKLNPGDIVMGEVTYVDDKFAKVDVIDTGVNIIITREELSPNKVLRASDEVFVGEHIQIVYTGTDEHNNAKFSRKYIIKDRYDDSLYSLSLMDLLKTMDIQTKTFIGKVISINDGYFFTELITFSDSDSEVNGKLLVDPINGKNILVRADNRLRNLLFEGEYYKTDISLPNADFRRKEGTPYLFSVSSPDLQLVKNPYQESVLLSFKQHTSPNTNTSVANLLEEVGQNLYSSKKRMFFELLQNADDAAAQNGVKVKLQLEGKYFLLTHDGYSFNKHDFESITSAAQSTKSANKKKTGYKGIGFKSVFTNSESVYIQSSGYRFGFDKSLDIYNDFDRFYFLVNDIENDPVKQKEFIHKFEKFRREFKGVKDIPWQLLPVWSNIPDIDKYNTIWSERENVCIALQMDEKTLSEYAQAIAEVFYEPRFMLFLRRTNRIQLMQGDDCRTIQKNISENGEYISLVNSFDKDKLNENYKIFTKAGIGVSDEAFKAANVNIKRKERTNIHGDIENYFVRLDSNGNEQSEVPGIPDRIASTADTEISFAIPLDEEGHIRPSNDALSLYAYLPMNEHRFTFPFFINADFIPKSDREGVQSDNPWNHFLFFNIGKAIVSMVEESASIDEPNYLNLLPQKEFESTSQDTFALIDSFNNGYTKALSESKFIINDKGEKSDVLGIILDESSLAETLGYDNYYSIICTTKRLPHPNLNTDILKRSIFKIEKTTTTDVIKIIQGNAERVLTWISAASDDERKSFWEWLTKTEDTIRLIPSIPSILLENKWVSYSTAINNSKVILITEKTLAIKDILIQLGFKCTDTVIEHHPLKDYLKKQDEQKLFERIRLSNTSILSHSDRLRLFHATKQFEGIGDETRKKWAIFKNAQGVFTPLFKMCAFSSTLPVWLKDYMIAQEEYSSSFASFLIGSENIYTSIVENNIDTILTKTDVYSVYQTFKQSWRHAFTQSLIRKRVPNILPVVEQEDYATKEIFVKAYGSFDLSSTVSYPSDGEHYRTIKIATESTASCQHLKSIIKVDGIPLSKITLKDDFSVDVNGVKYTFSLSSILPSHTNSSKLAMITDKFKSIAGYEKVFAQNEAESSWVKTELVSYLSQYYNARYTSDQYCFMMLFYRHIGSITLDTVSRKFIDSSNTQIFKEILEKCFKLKVGEILRSFINDPYISYSFGKVAGRYIDCDDYTLPAERIQPFIAQWADTDEKKSFLTTLGVHNETSDKIKRRKSFSENKFEDIWNISSSSIISTILSWVKASSQLPISENNKVEVLKLLFGKINVHMTNNEDDYSSAKEWTDEKYITWKANKTTRIYLYDGEMPYRGVYLGDYYFKGKQNNYTVFNTSGHIYINKDVEPEVVLADVYSLKTALFTKDDWREIFLISRASVNDLMSEVEKLRNQNSLLEEEIARNRDDEDEDATMQKGEDSKLSKQEMIQAQLEAQQALMRAYPDWGYPYGFGEMGEDGQPYCYSCNVITTENGSEPIVLKSFKYQGDKFMVNPTEYLYLIRDKAQLFIYDGLDFKRIPVLDLLKDQTKVSITFSSKNLESDDKIEKLADALHYFNNIQFNFDSFNISSRAESIRYIYKRNIGTQSATSDDDL